MRLGVCYNVFDAEELLETSIKSVRESVDYIVIVYQLISNFGQKANPFLESLLASLKEQQLIDEMIKYEPHDFSIDEKLQLIAPNSKQNLAVESIGNQFFHELSKREIGRHFCSKNNCSHFLSLDCDEYYQKESFDYAKTVIEDNEYDVTVCRMRTFFKQPNYELIPQDELNMVPFICKIDPLKPLRLNSDFPVISDPTRRLYNFQNFYFFDRDELEMFHYSFIRKNIKKKIENVSNKANYFESNNLEIQEKKKNEFLKYFENFKIGDQVLHPIPATQFKSVKLTENYFNIDFEKKEKKIN